MTELEKLARKYYQDRPEGFSEPTEDFMAGFRAARELAITIAICCTEKPNLNDDGHIKAKNYLDTLKQLGESEVRDETRT